jgi:predicted ferric reductase
VTGLHRNLSLLAIALLGIHVVTAITARHANVPWLSTIVPFTSGYQRLWVGLGAVALDLMAAVVVTSLLRDRLTPAAWRGVHLMAYAAYPVALGHSYGSHADVQSGWLFILGTAAVLAVAASFGYRVLGGLRTLSRPRRVLDQLGRVARLEGLS